MIPPKNNDAWHVATAYGCVSMSSRASCVDAHIRALVCPTQHSLFHCTYVAARQCTPVSDVYEEVAMMQYIDENEGPTSSTGMSKVRSRLSRN